MGGSSKPVGAVGEVVIKSLRWKSSRFLRGVISRMCIRASITSSGEV